MEVAATVGFQHFCDSFWMPCERKGEEATVLPFSFTLREYYSEGITRKYQRVLLTLPLPQCLTSLPRR